MLSHSSCRLCQPAGSAALAHLATAGTGRATERRSPGATARSFAPRRAQWPAVCRRPADRSPAPHRARHRPPRNAGRARERGPRTTGPPRSTCRAAPPARAARPASPTAPDSWPAPPALRPQSAAVPGEPPRLKRVHSCLKSAGNDGAPRTARPRRPGSSPVVGERRWCPPPKREPGSRPRGRPGRRTTPHRRTRRPQPRRSPRPAGSCRCHRGRPGSPIDATPAAPPLPPPRFLVPRSSTPRLPGWSAPARSSATAWRPPRRPLRRGGVRAQRQPTDATQRRGTLPLYRGPLLLPSRRPDRRGQRSSPGLPGSRRARNSPPPLARRSRCATRSAHAAVCLPATVRPPARSGWQLPQRARRELTRRPRTSRHRCV